MKVIANVALVPVILAACENPVENRATAPGPISAAVVVNNLSFKQTAVAINDCTGEAFNVQGIFHMLVTVTDDQVGGFHLTFHLVWADFKLTNTATGETFVTNQSRNFSVQSKAAQPVNEELTFTLAGPGGQTVTNEVAHIRFQFVVNANGTVTVSGFDFRVSCS